MQNLEQLKSSDPSHSVWVSASAGTGKTKVLTDRVLRLLLSGTLPAKILCLTFTNAAASEMMSRINHELKTFAQIGNEALGTKLFSLLGRKPIDTEFALAKKLFFIMLDSLEKVHVQTIHAFCQSLLRKFPFEAGIAPGFQVIDDIAADEILRKVSNVVFAHSEVGEIGEALKFIAANVHDSTMTDLLREIVGAKIKFKNLIERFKNAGEYKKLLRELMQVQDKTQEQIIDEVMDASSLGASLYSLKESANFTQLKTQFLTLEGKPRQKLMSKEEAALNLSKLTYLTELQSQVLDADRAIKTLNLIDASGHLFVIASSIINSYETHKKERGFLDYDDLIYLSQKLLGSSEFKQWVLYKLDGGLEAILVDEAQDTSEGQWQIIEALMQEFYAGLDDKARSVFVVGDEKQSIYSFQGASLGAYTGMSQYLKEQMLAAEKPYHVIDLAWSYRSTNAVLDVVNSSFNGEIFDELFPQIQKLKVFRNSHPGRVELWPIIKQEVKPDVFWSIFEKDAEEQSSGEKLAGAITSFIKQELGSRKIVASTGKPVALKDFMILLRRRGRFAGQLIKALNDKGLDSGGIDRLALSGSLSVLDLLSLAKFVLQPLDDLNLACLLKSPFVGMNEEELHNVILSRELIPGSRKSYEGLYKSLGSLNLDPSIVHIRQKLEQFQELYRANSMSDFFHIIVDGLGYRHLLLKYDGAEASDTINEFLYLADNFAKNVSSSLQEFVIWFDKNEVEIKRDVQNNDKIRIMTVHGSKGLQAPIVILVDTTTLPRSNDKILWVNDDMPLWAAGAANRNDYFDKCKEELESKEYKEYLRLLYVAMTRAEDRLIVTGDGAGNQSESWYNIVLEGMQELEASLESYDFLDEPVLVYATLGSCEADLSPIKERAILPLPSLPPIAPNYSSTLDTRNEGNSPLVSARGMTYGHIFHKIMEDIVKTRAPYLPQSHPMLDLLPRHQRDFISHKIKQLLTMKEFQDILKLDVRTEVSIGLQGDDITIGRIDLMAVGVGKVIILDYKTDKNPPQESSGVPSNYVDQLGFYRRSVEKIYPQHKIETKILWLENLTIIDV